MHPFGSFFTVAGAALVDAARLACASPSRLPRALSEPSWGHRGRRDAKASAEGTPRTSHFRALAAVRGGLEAGFDEGRESGRMPLPALGVTTGRGEHGTDCKFSTTFASAGWNRRALPLDSSYRAAVLHATNKAHCRARVELLLLGGLLHGLLGNLLHGLLGSAGLACGCGLRLRRRLLDSLLHGFLGGLLRGFLCSCFLRSHIAS